ncbi:uncharacterized protein LOC109539383 isoform X1 [Dendroctonus ponderosae]|uniref:uncharacterized protein LOC109539383 isoform X1 n=2 Tax=Dendroctonus ponderosae TaxID=77166 RepID=UPI0020357E92|nr:uncharacterized protein LOC109539383 isoform X1 [Dendroctonus ponderosae]KAH1008777.1 hypothetical protein HUJ05_009303 [Dendroctonus ponderosae]
MDRPVPAPREGKRPVPTPRSRIKANPEPEIKSDSEKSDAIAEEAVVGNSRVQTAAENLCLPNSDKMDTERSDQFNTFSKRVSSASKQIAGDLGQMVHDRKKAVIEGTRQSMRRLTRRFSSTSQDQKKDSQEAENNQDYGGTIEMFNNIRFDSPLRSANSIYSNVDNEVEAGSSNESLNLPPPIHPPPPLPDESLYDAPSNCSPIASSSNSSKSGIAPPTKGEEYERVFPAYRYNSESDICIDNTEMKLAENVDLTRSASWAFYDSVANSMIQEAIYGNISSSNEPSQLDIIVESNNSTRIETLLVPDKINNAKPSDYQRTLSNVSAESHSNSMYENHVVPRRQTQEKEDKIRASNSVLMQFDPLNHESSGTQFSEMNLLQELLQEDLYGDISESYTVDEGDWSVSNESDSGEFLNPPTPPMRFDSLPEEESKETEKSVSDSLETEKTSSKYQHETKSRSNWYTDTHLAPSRPPTIERKKSWLNQVKKHVLVKAPDVFKSKTSDNLVERPVLGGKHFVNKRGMLYKVQGGPVEEIFGEYSGRWCVLENADLFCYADNTCLHLKEHFPAANILSIQLLQDAKYKYRYDNDDLHCFELNITGKSRGGHVYGSRSISERRIWLQCLAEMLTQRFKSRLTTNYKRMGWAYVRQGVSGKWAGAWIMLSERELHFAVDRHSVKTVDLRKARCIVLHSYQDSDNNPKTSDKGPNMLVDCPDVTLHLRMWTARETKVWCHIVKLEAHNNGANIDQQQLTKNDIPVIVEKCINFIFAYGSISEGIYRKAGTSSAISELLAKFRKDAFAVQLTKSDHSEYEVATALKRFFRELPEPLFGCDHRQYLYEVAKHNVKDEKIRMFKAALDQLPPVSYKTAKKLLGHLHFISNQSAKNLMTVENLASIWGPTLMHYEDKDRPAATSGAHHVQDAEVVCQLIRHYRSVFPEDPSELEKEQLMLKVLQKCLQSPQGVVNPKTSGDLRVWIYLFNKEGKAHNIAIGPNRTAYEVCVELGEKINTPVHEIILEEVILSERLFRPIHHTEKVLDVVLKWGYWDAADRKDNYLTCVNLSKYWEYIIEKPLPISGELRFADSKSKLFKTLMFQFTQGTLSAFKDKTSEINIHSWQVEKLICYLGHECKRSPQSRWTMTFLENDCPPNRTKGSPFFGNVLVWNDAAMRANWISAILKAKHPNNLTPPPKLVSI